MLVMRMISRLAERHSECEWIIVRRAPNPEYVLIETNQAAYHTTQEIKSFLGTYTRNRRRVRQREKGD